ncbi:MAG: hypothetical protein IJU93_08215 [Lachnospiraceae bacterium]|nr:hypothetical protein [Lachnospiraceae bacterium]
MDTSMTAFIPFVNVFVVPMITFYIHYKRKNKEFVFSLKALLQYGIMTLIILLITKLMLMGFRILTGTDINHNAVTYTIPAVVVALLLPYVYDIWRKMCKEGEEQL